MREKGRMTRADVCLILFLLLNNLSSAAKADVLSTYDASQPRSETNFDPNLKVSGSFTFSSVCVSGSMCGSRPSLLLGIWVYAHVPSREQAAAHAKKKRWAAVRTADRFPARVRKTR